MLSDSHVRDADVGDTLIHGAYVAPMAAPHDKKSLFNFLHASWKFDTVAASARGAFPAKSRKPP